MPSSLAAEKYIRLTTSTRDGRPKHTPVWVTGLADGRLGFTTAAESWKMKRIRHTPTVEIVACDVRGRVHDGAEAVTATAEMRVGAGHAAVEAAIKAKYGWQFTAMSLLERVRSLGKDRGPSCAVVLTVHD